jgi:sulfite exporter TauE/SafE/copper chaperone CopZ/preprotein translocase subunit Sss1
MSRMITWRVHGMHCASCERLIEQELKSVPEVKDAEASLTQQRAGIEFDSPDREPDVSKAFEKLKTLGYRFERETPGARKHVAEISCDLPTKDPFQRRLLRAGVAIAIVGGVGFFILRPILKTIPSVSASASVAALFAFGIVASLSSCLASTGGYLLAFSSKNPSKSRTILIHIGRLSTFALGGAVLGLLGKGLPVLGGGFYGTLALILGIGFFFAALNLLDLSPSLAKYGIRLPKFVSRMADKAASSESAFAPLLVGASTFILPCGFTQTVQALALASGDPIRGMFMMFFFGLGTLPVLGGLTAFGSFATLRHRAVRLAIGSVLFVFAINQINGGLTVLGSPITPETVLASVRPNTAAATDTKQADEQVLRMSVTNSGYQPSQLTVKVGIPVRWEINGIDVGGCTSGLVVPSLHIERTLNKGQNLISFTPTKTGTIPFSCAMGMVRGTITVIN